jgi:hypothetical protein
VTRRFYLTDLRLELPSQLVSFSSAPPVDIIVFAFRVDPGNRDG